MSNNIEVEKNLDDKYEIITIDKVQVAIDRSIVSSTIIAAMNKRQYEHVEARLGGQLFDTEEIGQGQVVLEVGAGLGYVGSALFLSGKIQSIISYEANPNLIPLLRETHRLNGVTSDVRNFILGEKSSGMGSIYVPEHFWAAQTERAVKGEVHNVRNCSLQTVINEEKPSFMLIDIEGGEQSLFDGIVELPTVHSLLIELHQKVIGRDGIKRFFEKMHQLGFGYDQRFSHGKVVLFQKLDHPMTF